MASEAARLMFSGVSKSGSPAPKSKTLAPVARNASAACIAARVEDACILPTLSAAWNREPAGLVVIAFGDRESTEFNEQTPLQNFLFHSGLNQSWNKALKFTP